MDTWNDDEAIVECQKCGLALFIKIKALLAGAPQVHEECR